MKLVIAFAILYGEHQWYITDHQFTILTLITKIIYYQYGSSRPSQLPAYQAQNLGHKVVSVVKWHDNQCVTVATNYDTIASAGKVRRWSSAKKTSVDVQQPTVVTNYNLHMGGVDLLD